MEYNIIHKRDQCTFELHLEGEVAHIDYILTDDTINFTHTFVPKALEGRGIGSALTKFALDFADSNHLKVIPTCPFVKIYIERHPAYQHLEI